MGTSLPEKTSTIGNQKATVPSLFNSISLLAPLKAPKSYGTYSKQQQEEVIAFIKDGNSLRTAEKFFGIPKSTMHCWLKKIHNSNGENHNNLKTNNSNDSLDSYTMANKAFDREVPTFTRKSPTLKTSPLNLTTSSSTSHTISSRLPNSMTAITSSNNTSNGGKKPQAQIIIEEAELIRFLQTGEGAELIGKAYNVPVTGFLDFVKNSQLTKKDTSQKFSGNLKNVDIASLLKQGATIKEEGKKTTCTHSNNNMYQGAAFKSNAMRKRNYNTSGCNCPNSNPFRTAKTTITELKKPKLEAVTEDTTLSLNLSGRNGSALEALLTRPRAALESHKTNKLASSVDKGTGLFLTEEQLKTSSKLISQAQPGVVNTYLVTVPLSNLSNNLTTVQQVKVTDDVEECELSPTYPKMINPVSIKAERGESDCMMRPPSDCLTFTVKDSTCSVLNISTAATKMQQLLSQATKPVVSTNASAALNLNAINRSQSERELMALVGGDVVSADELCNDFKETLELNKWETWYTDQYLQHFQPSISPVSVLSNDPIMSPSVTSAPDMLTSPSVSLEDGLDEEDDDGLGITFATNVDKDKIISYLAEGNSVTDAEKHFDIPQSTISLWLSSIKQKNSEQQQDNMPRDLIQHFKQEPSDEFDLDASNSLHHSAFSVSSLGKNRVGLGCTKSAFSRHTK